MPRPLRDFDLYIYAHKIVPAVKRYPGGHLYINDVYMLLSEEGFDPENPSTYQKLAITKKRDNWPLSYMNATWVPEHSLPPITFNTTEIGDLVYSAFKDIPAPFQPDFSSSPFPEPPPFSLASLQSPVRLFGSNERRSGPRERVQVLSPAPSLRPHCSSSRWWGRHPCAAARRTLAASPHISFEPDTRASVLHCADEPARRTRGLRPSPVRGGCECESERKSKSPAPSSQLLPCAGVVSLTLVPERVPQRVFTLAYCFRPTDQSVMCAACRATCAHLAFTPSSSSSSSSSSPRWARAREQRHCAQVECEKRL